MEKSPLKRVRIGVLSDTHGVIKDSVLKAFDGVDLIIHAGDVVKKEILDALGQIAPVAAVRGNMDKEEWSASLPVSKFVDIGEARIYIIHDLDKLDIDPRASGVSVVIFGHTHKQAIVRKGGVLYVNPGSAGNFIPTNTVAILEVFEGEVKGRLADIG